MNKEYQGENYLHKRWSTRLLVLILSILVFFLLFYKLDSWPSVWWDEGWTLDAARNWIEQGHLGHYLEGEPIPPHIPVRFPVVVPVALSMKLFGVGTWQGRLPVAVSTLLALGSVFYLTRIMFSTKTASAALIMIFFLSVYGSNPLIIGRQVMAEMPMMFYLLAGYAFVWLALTRSKIWIMGAILCFGVAFHAKLQVPPFWLASMGLTIIASMIYKQNSNVRMLIVITGWTITFAALTYLLQNKFMAGSFNDFELIHLLFNSVVFVIDPKVRTLVLFQILLFGFPVFLGYLWSGWHLYKTIGKSHIQKINQIDPAEINKNILRIAIWGLGASWFIWYSTMSIHTIRYFFPPLFIGTIFFAAWVSEATNGFDIRLFTRRISALFLRRDFKLSNAQSLLILMAISINFTAAIKTDQIGLTIPSYDPILASEYLRENIPSEAMVESFESELFFLTPQVKFHFPSDLVSMQAQRKTSIDFHYPIDYDPLESNPDYLVVGYMGSIWPLYDDVIANGLARLERDIGGYRIYKFQRTQMH